MPMPTLMARTYRITIRARRDQLKKKNAPNAPMWKKMMKESVIQVTPEGTVAARPMRTCSRAGVGCSTPDADESVVEARGFCGTNVVASSEEGRVTTDAIR